MQQPNEVSTSAASSGALAISPILANEDDLRRWYQGAWRPLTLSSNVPAQIGGSVLWKGAKKGRGRGISTKAEYFKGMLHILEVVGWIFLTTSAEMWLLKITEDIHLMYVFPTDEEWSVAPGGRCFKTFQCLATMRKFCQCPVADCKKWFNGVDPFQPHSATLHAPQ